MALYSEAITHPYMRVVRGPGTESTNILDLGGFHQDVQEHCQRLIDEPELLLSDDASAKTATLDGLEWEHPEVIAAIQKLLPELPHVKPALVAFCEGALETWIRFSAEFAPSGLIDEATEEEKRLAWMPSTNDHNEGALGSYRVYMRAKPSTTIQQYNAQAVYKRNQVGLFMENMLTEEEDHLYLMRRAREMDASGMEAKRKAAQVEFETRRAAINLEKDNERKQKQAETAARLSEVVLLTDLAQIPSLKVKDIEDHLTIIAKLDAEVGIPKYKKDWGQYKDDKANLLKESLERYKARHGSFPTRQAPPKGHDIILESWDECVEEDIEMEG
jgi:hypothetical protein